MITSITLSYTNKEGQLETVNLNSAFVQRCIEEHPAKSSNRRIPISKKKLDTFKKLSVRKKITAHIHKYVADLKGRNELYVIHSL